VRRKDPSTRIRRAGRSRFQRAGTPCTSIRRRLHGNQVVLMGNRNDLPRICPATDRDTTGNHPSARVDEALVRRSFVFSAAGRGVRWIKLIIRRSQVQVLPAPPRKAQVRGHVSTRSRRGSADLPRICPAPVTRKRARIVSCDGSKIRVERSCLRSALYPITWTARGPADTMRTVLGSGNPGSPPDQYLLTIGACSLLLLQRPELEMLLVPR
jgi:hypothetical protein